MTSLSCRFWFGIGVAAVGGLAQAQSAQQDPLAPLPQAAPVRPQPAPAQMPPRVAPASLRDRLAALGRAFNGNAGIDSKCLQIVTKRVQFTGNSAITNVCPSDSGGGAFDGQRIRLVE